MKLGESLQSVHRRSLNRYYFHQKGNVFVRFIFPLVGCACLIWYLVRVIPKPARAEYPCMKVAAPIAGGFLTYLIGLSGAVLLFKKARHYFRNSKYALASSLILAGAVAGLFTVLHTDNESYAHSVIADSLFVPIDSANSPIGTARGIFPGRVVWMRDSSATKWNGTSNYWWTDANTDQVVVDSMMSKSLRGLTGKFTDDAAWDTLFKYFNEKHGKGIVGYKAGEKIAIKLSLVQSANPSYHGGNSNFSTPQLVLALLRQLVHKAGVPDNNITFYDIMRSVPSSVTDKCKSEFPNVHFVGSFTAGNQEVYKRDTTSLHWSENLILEQPTGGLHTGYLPTIVTKASYIINFANLKGHRYVGVTGCAKNHFGSMSADGDVNTPHAIGLHSYVTVHDFIINGSPEWSFYGRPMGTYNALVDLMGNKDLGGKTILFLTDGLYVVPTEGDPNTSAIKFQQPPFNNRWTSSIFISQDEVALESVIIDFLRTEQAINNKLTQIFPDGSLQNVVFGNVDNYLHEAAQADNPPSGTFYHPNGDSIRLQSLGVHEHWNNPVDKQYTRNLGTGEGIELIGLQSSMTSVIQTQKPSAFALYQNYPNPFNPSTVIVYELLVRSSVSLDVFDALGRRITTLVDEEQQSGTYKIQFNARDLSSGVYFYRLQVRQISRGQDGKCTETKKFVLLK